MDHTREEILAPTAPRICSACPACLEECDPQEGPGHPLQSQAERNLLCRERATYLHSKQVAADGKSVRYGSVINCCNCRLYLAQGAGAGGPGHSSSMFMIHEVLMNLMFTVASCFRATCQYVYAKIQIIPCLQYSISCNVRNYAFPYK